MVRAICCVITAFLATVFMSAQEVRSTVGPLEQSAKPSSPENPIPRRTASAQPVTPPEFRPPATRGTVRLQVTLNSEDRKSTRLNSSHSQISYAVFCLKKKKKKKKKIQKHKQNM